MALKTHQEWRASMELIEYGEKAVTIKMSANDFAKLCDIISAAATEYKSFDREILTLTQDEVRTLRSRILKVQEQGLAKFGLDMKTFYDKINGTPKSK